MSNYTQYNLSFADNHIKLVIRLSDAQLYHYAPYGLIDNAVVANFGHYDYTDLKTIGTGNRQFLQNTTPLKSVLDYSTYVDSDVCRDVPRFPY